MAERSYHMTPDEFRRWGRETVEWVARYMERVEDMPVRSTVAPGEIRSRLPANAPDEAEAFDNVLADLDEIVLPGITHWQSPNWFAYFPANASGPAILGDLVASGLGVQGMLWATSPAGTEVETHVLDWLVDLMGLPAAFRSTGPGGGVIQDTASSAALCVIVAARHRAVGDDVAALPWLRAYTSSQAHSSVEKGIRIAGLAPEQLRLIDVDDELAMRPEALAAAIKEDWEAGLMPFLIVATAGTTSSMAFDPVPPIGDICQRHGLWLHVDAAMAGSAALMPEYRWVAAGAELADSWCFNPHKWLFTNFDCDVLWVADRAPLLEALNIVPEYLRNEATESGAVIDYRDWHVQLGRRFRALKLWFVLRWYGAEGLRHHLREHVELAREVSGWADADERFDRLTPTRLNLVCFAHRDGDEATQRLLDAVNDTGRAYLTHTRIRNRLAIRMCVGQTWTERRHVEAAWKLIAERAG
ncbi:MAG: pyridoxal-dependent decarboxylase [Acidimicrobiales bacterium]